MEILAALNVVAKLYLSSLFTKARIAHTDTL